MCGRYTLTEPSDVAEELAIELPRLLEPHYNVAPTDYQARRWIVPGFARTVVHGKRGE